MVFKNEVLKMFNSIDLEDYKPSYNKAYMIAITPRSGSTLICDILKQSNIAGNPKEYLNPDFIKQRIEKYSENKSLKEFFNTVINYTKSSNGVFGIKISYYQAYPFIEKDLLLKLLPNVKVINLFRRNIIKQAISLDIAARTKVFHSWDNVNDYNERLKKLEFNRESLLRRVYELYEEEKGWINFLDRKAVSYMKLFYEDNILDIDKTIKKILTYIDLNIKDYIDKDFSESVLKKIATDKNEEFYNKFINDKELVDKVLNFGLNENRL